MQNPFVHEILILDLIALKGGFILLLIAANESVHFDLAERIISES